MSDSNLNNKTADAARKFFTEHPTADIIATKQFAQKNFADRDEQRQFIKAFFDIAVTKAEFESDVDRMWPERKGY